jgi:molybdopterin molybdotransferase
MDIGGRGFNTGVMLSLEEARERILAVLTPLPIETVALASAPGRVLAADVFALIDLPPFDNSAMDGYAVRAADVAEAKPEAPVTLKLAGQVATGEMFAGEVPPGACVRIFTGSALPAGADAVVMQEDTRSAPAKEGQPVQVCFLDGAKPRENVRLRGEDVKRGALLLAAGERVNAGRAGLLAAMGLNELRVRRQPAVGLLATGSELLESGQAWSRGKIFESNRIMLAALVTRAGAMPQVFPLVPDSLEETKRALQQAFNGCDAVVTSGGVSVGELDFVKKAFVDLGGSMEFWRVSVKPGKPFVFGRWREKFLFGLPGNPLSAFVTFLLLVRPALWRWQGARDLELPTHACVLEEPLTNRGDRRHFMRVRVDETGRARSAGGQASHLLNALAVTNGLVDVPPNTTLPAGATVKVMRLED